jgi:predicted ABC-type transport system involved in lysophospholipase L1 biosynthesis ATPase subunit
VYHHVPRRAAHGPRASSRLAQGRYRGRDEPTGNLDAGTTEVVWQAFVDTAAQGATVILATHDDALAKRADARLTVGA